MSSEAEKTAADAANIDDGGMDAGRWGANTVSTLNLNSFPSARQPGRIEKYLLERGHIGRANAIPGIDLAQQVGYAGNRSRNCVRRLQQEIAREADETGALILSDAQGSGYFLAADRSELLQYLTTLNNRSVRTQRRLRAVRQALKKVDGQITIDSILGGGDGS